MMRIAIFGGYGMVGRNLRDHPAAAGAALSVPRRAELDLFDRRAVSDYLRAEQPDLVILVAGKVGGIEANRRAPVAFLTENLQIGMNVVLCSQEAGIPRLLNLASSCMYPRDSEGFLSEDMILTGALEPTNEGYALAKIAITRLCAYIRQETTAYKYKTLIPCNLYGRYDSFDPIRSHLVPAMIRKIAAAVKHNAGAVEIWGDGSARREFMYAEDFSDCVWEAVCRFDDLPGEMNVGLGQDWSINDYYITAAKAIGWNGPFVHDLEKPSGMRRKVVDIKRQTDFGWAPRFTLEEGLMRTYRFYLADVESRAVAA